MSISNVVTRRSIRACGGDRGRRAVVGSHVRGSETLRDQGHAPGTGVASARDARADAPAALCFEVLADFDRLEEFFPGLVSSDIVSGPGEPIVLRQLGDAKAAFSASRWT